MTLNADQAHERKGLEAEPHRPMAGQGVETRPARKGASENLEEEKAQGSHGRPVRGRVQLARRKTQKPRRIASDRHALLRIAFWRPIHCPKQQRGDSRNGRWVADRGNTTNRQAGPKLQRAGNPMSAAGRTTKLPAKLRWPVCRTWYIALTLTNGDE